MSPPPKPPVTSPPPPPPTTEEARRLAGDIVTAFAALGPLARLMGR